MTQKLTMSRSNGSSSSSASGAYYSSNISFSASSFSTSNTSSGGGGQSEYAKSITQSTHGNSRDGTSSVRTTHETGRPSVREESYYPPAGGRVERPDERARIEDVSDEPDADEEKERKEREREYEERMEDEYAKREGGA